MSLRGEHRVIESSTVVKCGTVKHTFANFSAKVKRLVRTCVLHVISNYFVGEVPELAEGVHRVLFISPRGEFF